MTYSCTTMEIWRTCLFDSRRSTAFSSQSRRRGPPVGRPRRNDATDGREGPLRLSETANPIVVHRNGLRVLLNRDGRTSK
jgi:hypothetical protein